MPLNPYTNLLIISIYLAFQYWLRKCNPLGRFQTTDTCLIPMPRDYNLIGMRYSLGIGSFKSSPGECNMQPMLRTIARVFQQSLGESYILESGRGYFQTIPQPITFHFPYLAFHSKGGESESQTPRQRKSIHALLEYPR